MASSLTASLLLLSLVFMQFVSAADQNTIKAEPGNNIILPCKDPDQGGIIVVEWSRTGLGDKYVFLFRNDHIDHVNQHLSYKNRADLLLSQMKVGDASLILKNATIDDSGTYECRVKQKNSTEKLNSIVNLQVAPPPPKPFPVWAKVLLVLLVLALAAAAGVSFYFWRRSRLVPKQKEVESGVENKDLSLTLSRPTDGDENTFTCRVSRDGDVLMEKRVHFQVKAPDMEVESGVESVELPWTITEDLDGNVTVEWRVDRCRKVNVYQNGSDQPGEQNQQVVKAQQVEVEPGEESVLLPCRTTENLDGDVRVEWMDGQDDVVHVYQNGSDQPGEQNHQEVKGTAQGPENTSSSSSLDQFKQYLFAVQILHIIAREGTRENFKTFQKDYQRTINPLVMESSY